MWHRRWRKSRWKWTSSCWLAATLTRWKILLTAACSSDDELLTEPINKSNTGKIHFTATISNKDILGSLTRALTEEGGKLVAKWQVGENISLYYNVEGEEEEVRTVAEVTAVDEMTGEATIEADLDERVENNTPVKLVYPNLYQIFWNDTEYGLENFFLGDGAVTLARSVDLNSVSKYMDVRRGTDNIIVDDTNNEVKLEGTATLDPLLAICKFTFVDSDNQPLDIQWIEMIDATTNKMIKIILPYSDDYGSVFYAVMPPMSGVSVRFRCSDGTDCYKATATATLEAGKYYRPTVKMKKIPTPIPLGEVTEDYIGFTVGSDWQVYPPRKKDISTVVTAIAMIAYVGAPGTADASSTTLRGLAIGAKEFSKENEYDGDAKYPCFSWTFEQLEPQYIVSDAEALGDMNGILNTEQMPVEEQTVNDGYPDYNIVGYTHTLGWALKTLKNSDITANRPVGVTGWFIPSLGQWMKVLQSFGADNINTLTPDLIRPKGYNVNQIFRGYPGGRFRADYSPLFGDYDNYCTYWTSTKASSDEWYGEWESCAYLMSLYNGAPRYATWGKCVTGGNALPFFAF